MTRGDERRVGVAEGELAAALVVERVGLVEHEHARLSLGADLLEDVLDRARHRVSSSSGALASTTCSSRSARLRLLERRGERVDELMRAACG